MASEQQQPADGAPRRPTGASGAPEGAEIRPDRTPPPSDAPASPTGRLVQVIYRGPSDELVVGDHRLPLHEVVEVPEEALKALEEKARGLIGHVIERVQ